ncbi:MAG: type II toxin-antitoxin system PemK/MazF family toxin [Epsilonproteobacteria bacterium]|nr:type II toxin-antitoxin system PemK/MazF family toxin [Campylobacterota bacterium]
MFKKGEIYLAKLNPRKGSEVGKVRPILIFQTNMLNEIEHPTTVIIPLSTYLIDDAYPLRYRVSKREALEQDSDLLCDQIRAIDNQRIVSDKLAELSLQELLEVDEQIKIVLELE